MMLNPGWYKTKSERLVAVELSCDFGDKFLVNFLRELNHRWPWGVFSLEGQIGDTEVREVDSSPFTRPCGIQGFYRLKDVLVVLVLELPYYTLLFSIHGVPQSEYSGPLLIVSG
jgi:hypothetical protein